MNPYLMYAFARARTEELLRDAARHRLARSLPRTRRRRRARERLGWLLVEAGLRLSVNRRVSNVWAGSSGVGLRVSRARTEE